MDPEQTLTEAEEAAESGLVADAQYLLDTYADWRSMGGFAANDERKRLARIKQRLGRQARHFQRAR
jgi:hypothetical protein